MFGFAAVTPFAMGSIANSTPTIASTKNVSDAPKQSVITLQRQEMKSSGGSGGIYTISGYHNVGPQLGISVGNDGHMWLNINNEWKKVVVE
jgi:hypothetical protein